MDDPLAVGSVVGGRYRIVGPSDERPTFLLFPVEAIEQTKASLTILVVHDLVTRDPNLEARFLKEIVEGDFSAIEGRITKPIDGGVDRASALAWLVFETPWGAPLSKVVESGALPFQEAGALLRELASALDATHAAGFPNGALSLENLWYKPAEGGGQAVVTQLVPGLVDLIAEGLKPKPGETRAGFVLPKKSVAYLPAEAISGAAVQERAPKDVWAFGLIAFELFTGHSFWKKANDENATLLALMNEIMSEPIPQASTRANELGRRATLAGGFGGPVFPPAFDTFFRSCVKREPSARLTMREVEGDVRRWTREVLASPDHLVMPATIAANPKGSHYDAGLLPKPILDVRPPPPADDGRGRLRLALVIIAALVVLAIVIVLLQRQG